LKKISIAFKVISALFLTIFVSMFLFGVFLFIVESAALHKEMDVSVKSISERLANTLVSPIWNFQDSEIEKIVQLEIIDRSIKAITVKDENGFALKDFYKDRNDKLNSDFNLAIKNELKKYKVIKKDIVKEESKIGEIEIYLSNSHLKKKLSNLRYKTFFQIVIVSSLCIIILIVFFKKLIIDKLNQVVVLLKDIGEGEGDLTKQITIDTNDEIGELAKYYNIFIDKLKLIIIRLKEISLLNTQFGEGLAKNTEDMSASNVEVLSTIDSIKNKIEILNGEITSSSRLMDNVSSLLGTMVSEVKNQNDYVNKSMESLNDLRQKINMVNDIASDNKKLSNNLNNLASFGEKDMRDAINSIKDISQSVFVIIDMIKIINNVASQTNLVTAREK